MENEKTSRPQPYSRLIGCRNRPKPARTPKEMHMMRQPQTRTTSGVRQAWFAMGRKSIGRRVGCAGQLRLKTTRRSLELGYVRQAAGEDALAQHLDRLRAGKAAPPGKPHPAH